MIKKNGKRLSEVAGVALIALSGWAGCTQGDNQPLMAAGLAQAIELGEVEEYYPAVGVLPSRQFPSGYCTGTLIDPSWVLTANHCGFPAEFWLGTSKLDFVKYPVDDRIHHPTLSRDLQLLHLATPVPVERIGDTPVQFQPLLAPNASTLPAVLDECIGVGFGKHQNEDGTTTKGIKRSCTMSVVSADPNLIEMQLVTGIPNNHDSGGPLICNGNIAAVVRSHLGQWPNYNREIYTTVDAPWIQETIANYSGRVAPPTRDRTAKIHLIGNDGPLCPEGSLYMRDNTLVADQSTAPLSSSERLHCSIDLALELPTDQKLARAQVCPYFELYDLEGATAVDFDYAVDGTTVDNEPIEVSALADVEGACRTVDVNAATCGAPVTVPIHIELSAHNPTATPFRFVSLDHMLEDTDGSWWSPCSDAEN